MGKGGVPLEVAGNPLCWINQWEFIRQGQDEKSTNKLLWHWNDKKVAWSSKIPWGEKFIRKSLGRFARYCRLERADEICNSWGRKTLVTVALGEMMLPAGRVMGITTHKSEKQMRNDYLMSHGHRENRAATARLVNEYASGGAKRLPPTSHEQYNAVRKEMETMRQDIVQIKDTLRTMVEAINSNLFQRKLRRIFKTVFQLLIKSRQDPLIKKNNKQFTYFIDTRSC